MIDKDEIIFGEMLSPKQCKGCVFAVTKYPHGEQWEKASCIKYPQFKPDDVMENKGKCPNRLILEEYVGFPDLTEEDKEQIRKVIRSKK